MPDILIQDLEVSYFPATRTHPQAGMNYRTRPVEYPNVTACHHYQSQILNSFVPVSSWEGLRSDARSLQEMVWDLIDQSSGRDLFDKKAQHLAKDILPEGGFARIFGTDFHPQLYIRDEYAAHIPWEFLQECHWICPNCHYTSEVLPPPPERICPSCKKEMRVMTREHSVAQYVCQECRDEYDLTEPPRCQYCNVVMQRNESVYVINNPLIRYQCPQCRKECDGLQVRCCQLCPTPMEFRIIHLTTEYYMTHLPDVSRNNPPSEGDHFLIVGDPKGDLSAVTEDPDHVCRNHLDKLYNNIEQKGFTVDNFPGASATRQQILQKISDPSVFGAYFFCHGGYDEDAQQGFLQLSDSKLFAADIQKANPRVSLIFLNACHSGHMHVNVGAESFNKSVAQGFISTGLGRTLIAPICPVVNTVAAKMAMEFFNHMLKGKSFGEALIETRRQSLDRYNGDVVSDISWMAYRYYGDPNRSIPCSQPTVRLRCRVFHTQDRLNKDVFAFDIAAVLLRAAKRRNQQKRKFATPTDIVAGLVRVGELTRHILTERGFNPDELYENFGQAIEDGQKKSAELLKAYEMLSKEELDIQNYKKHWRKVVNDWILENKADFTPKVVTILTQANKLAEKADSEDHRISEETILRVIIDKELWPSEQIQDLPDAEMIRSDLNHREQLCQVDENGTILLDDLTLVAKKDVENALSVALRGGTCPIPNPALLAGMTTDPDSYGTRVFECIGISSKFVCYFMKAWIGDKEANAESFGLSPHACSSVVTPTLERAREKAALRSDSTVTDMDLFNSFWEIADIKFKHKLSMCLQIDPDRLARIDPNHPSRMAEKISSRYPDFSESLFDGTIWKMLTIAANVAFVQNSPSVRMPHLFIGMISRGKAAREFLQQNKLDRHLLTIALLSTIPCQQPTPERFEGSPDLSENVCKVLDWAIEMARTRHRARPIELDLFKAFFTEGGSIVGETLRSLGIRGSFRFPTQEKNEKDYINMLGEWLSVGIVGQPMAIRTLQASLCKNLSDRNRPWRVFGFVGPICVGRGMISRIIGKWMCGGDEGKLSVDLSQVGLSFPRPQENVPNAQNLENEMRNRITEWLRAKPCSVLEFKGVAEAQEPARAMLLQLLTEGVMKGMDGRIISAKRAIVILQFNVSGQQIQEIITSISRATDSDQLIQDELRGAIANMIPTQIIECLDALIPFISLDSTDLEGIAEHMTSRLNRILRVTDRVSVKVDSEIWKWLVSNSLDDKRPAQSITIKVQELIRKPLLKYLNTTPVERAATIVTSLINGKVVFRIVYNDNIIQ